MGGDDRALRMKIKPKRRGGAHWREHIGKRARTFFLKKSVDKRMDIRKMPATFEIAGKRF
jgi:hypothetical protein